jgi:hypothetical protein
MVEKKQKRKRLKNPTNSKRDRLRQIARYKAEFSAGLSERAAARIRINLAIPVIDEIVAWLHSKPSVHYLLSGNPFPRTYAELEPRHSVLPNNAEFEIRWHTANLTYYSESIQAFVDQKIKFETELLKSNFTNCRNILDKIERDFGKSYWLISNRFALLQLTDGLESQKTFLSDITQEGFGFVNYISYLFSYKNEVTTIPSQFHKFVVDSNRRSSLDEEYSAFVQFLCIPGNKYDDHEIASVMSYTGTSSIVDGYEAILRLARVIIAREMTSLLGPLNVGISRLKSRINDSNLRSIMFALEKEASNEMIVTASAIEMFESLLRGNPDDVRARIERHIESNVRDFDVWEIAVKSQLFRSREMDSLTDLQSSVGKRNSYMEGLLIRLSTLLDNDDSGNEVSTEIIKASFNFNTHNWSTSLMGFISRECKKEIIGVPNVDATFGALFSTRLHPMRILSTPADKKLKYVKAIAAKVPRRLGLLYSEVFVESPADPNTVETLKNELSTDEFNLLMTNLAFRNEDAGECLLFAEELCNSPISYYQNNGIRFKAAALLNSDPAQCVRFCVSTLLRKPQLIRMLPLSELASGITNEEKIALGGSLALPILYDQYSNSVSDDLDHRRSFALEDVLEANGVRRPSQLNDLKDRFNKEELVYLLRNIAIESVMDTSTEYSGTSDLANERLKICQILTELDPHNTEQYQAEIININRRLLFERRMREVEQSRVYFDRENIKKKVMNEARESFNRYLTFLGEQIDPRKLTYKKNKFQVIGVEGKPLIILGIPDDELVQVFASIFTKIRDEYVSNVPNGLDAFLSVRIRHGTLGAQLRNTLEKFGLVTQKDYKTNEYEPNEYWRERIVDSTADGDKEVKGLVELDKKFARFSLGIDRLVQEILSKWIQVRRNPDEIGEFDFYFSPLQIGMLSTRLSPDTDFETFVEYLLDIFENRLTLRLERVRLLFSEECKARLVRLLTSLQTDVTIIGSNYHLDVGELSAAIVMGRTEIINVVDRITKWFTLSKSTAKEPFSIDEAIQISENSVRTLGNEFEISLHDGCKSLKILGKHLNAFVDIFFILFENIVRHSHNGPSQNAKVAVATHDEMLTIIVENGVTLESEEDSVRSRVNIIREAIDRGDYVRNVAKEGGTGLHKVFNILRSSFSSNSTLSFDFTNDSRFIVTFGIPIGDIQAERDENTSG